MKENHHTTMHEYRITKYNPAHRNEQGAYLKDEWTSFSDIGKIFDGEVLPKAQYEKVEAAYIDVALSFFIESQSEACYIEYLENHASKPLPCKDENNLSPDELRQLMKGILREEYWARIEADSFFVHFGWDYYMYVGVSQECPKSIELATAKGLFVEPFLSPYNERTEVTKM